MTDPPVPPQAITAAAAVLTNVILNGRHASTGDELMDAAVAKLMLEAALPHLAAAEREACAQLAEQHDARVWVNRMSSDDPPQPYMAQEPFAALLREARP